jgi:alkylation response protein AidB-like acyl-CoA dehydrogenase
VTRAGEGAKVANYFLDNDDVQFLFEHSDLRRLATLYEEGFRFCRDFDFAPEDSEDAVDNYRRLLTSLGELAADVIAPTAAETDRVGNVLNEDGSVSYAPGIAEALKRLSQADLMGFTLPYRFGGLNCPQLVYTISNEIVSRADASLMNLYGLQGIAETINAYADETIKEAVLPEMAAGRKTGAMVLTEPDAGSDLQAIKVRAFQDGAGSWFVQGVKRFITNGCGDVLLVLARSEPGMADARGLSLFLVERGPRVRVRRLEEKLGIHGSPTCELFFDDAPARLVGQRQRGLVTYVMSLMNGARIGIAAQSLGIGEAAYRVARDYAAKRKQFGVEIDRIPAVRELLVDMSVDLQAARALTYYASFSVDLETGTVRAIEGRAAGDDESRRLLREVRWRKRVNAMLTPMSKYVASEMSMRVANGAVAVLGGSGYMKDYSVERHLRDSRITTIYEGTSQLQVVAAMGGVVGGTARTLVEDLLERAWPEAVAPLAEQVRVGLGLLDEAVGFAKEHQGAGYLGLYSRRIVDMACTLIVAALLCGQAAAKERKVATARRWLAAKLPELRMNREMVCSGDELVMTEFDALAGAMPAS